MNAPAPSERAPAPRTSNAEKGRDAKTRVRRTILPAMQTRRLSVFLFFATGVGVAQTAAPLPTQAQPQSDAAQVWQMQDSGTTAGLRGIDSVDGTVAWASGTEGTVLRTIDGGAHWTKCAVPDAVKDGATLDFRGVQAWDSDTAIVMASGPGEKSRLYKTTDSCKSWILILRNTEPEGFFDAFWLNAIYGEGILLGDPVNGQFTVLNTEDGGLTWRRDKSKSLDLLGASLAAFAASNSSIGRASRGEGDARGPGIDYFPGFITGGKGGAFLIQRWEGRSKTKARLSQGRDANMWLTPDWNRRPIPLAAGADSAGAFALALRYTGSPCADCGFGEYWHLVAVGGDYTKPNERVGTAAASSTDGGWTWTASTIPPHGYRSTVQWGESIKAWITAGTNGSDISRDDGRTWQPLDNGNWNALSLPFIVGPRGRIARLNPSALPPAK
jgi:photosystem II stability/assembly factor-like uncharacterized protein